MPQVAFKISEPIFAKLKRLAHQQHANYATIVEAALSAYEPDTSEPASHGASEIHGDLQALIESALQPVLERLAMLESLGLVKQQHPSGLTVQISPQNAPEIAVAALKVEATPIIYQPEPKPAEMALEAAVEALPEGGYVRSC